MSELKRTFRIFFGVPGLGQIDVGYGFVTPSGQVSISPRPLEKHEEDTLRVWQETVTDKEKPDVS